MLQSAFRPLTNHLTTNWPIVWAARLDVALGCGLLLFGAPIIFWLGRDWLGRDLLQQKWGTTDLANLLAFIIALVVAGTLVLWVISVGRVYRGMSPQMSQYPRFIDILLGTVMIVAPTVVLTFLAGAQHVQNIGFDLGVVSGIVGGSVAFSTMLAFILITILRSSMKVALLSFFGVIMSTSYFDSTVTSVVTLWFPPSPDKKATVTTAAAVEFFTALAVIAFLIWILSGTTHVRARERLIAIGFPPLFAFTWNINDVVLQLLGLAVVGDKGGIDYLITYANPQAAFVQAPLALAVTIILGEVLSRRWARLTLMPK